MNYLKTNFVAIIYSLFITMILFSCTAESTMNLVEDPEKITPNPPVLNPLGGNYDKDITVSLTTDTPGAVIYYTTDGTEPTVKSKPYVSVAPIEIMGNGTALTIKAIAVKDEPSTAISGEYKINYALVNPVAPVSPIVKSGDGKLSVSWSEVSGANCYNLYYSKTNDPSTAVQAGDDITTLNYIITGLKKEVTYFVWVKAKNSVGSSDFSTVVSAKNYAPVGYKETFSVDNISFKMVYVPGGMTFPIGNNDTDTLKIENSYWVAEKELSYELWKAVYNWATSAERGSKIYYFQNPGHQGGDTSSALTPSVVGTIKQPVTKICWRDAMVWSNALTEWYNAKNGTNFVPVFYTDAAYTTPHRDSRSGSYSSSVNTNDGGFDKPYIKSSSNGNFDILKCTADGFRILSVYEWELAARYRGNDKTNCVTGTINGFDFDNPPDSLYWTKGVSASGVPNIAAGDDKDEIFSQYAWFNNTFSPTFQTHEPGGKLPNKLGIYDMSGNVEEHCFDWNVDFWAVDTRYVKGQHWASTRYWNMEIGHWNYKSPWDVNVDRNTGFRFSRTD